MGDKTVYQLCEEYHANKAVFVIICNLYKGFYADEKAVRTLTIIPEIIYLLKDSHHYYNVCLCNGAKCNIIHVKFETKEYHRCTGCAP